MGKETNNSSQNSGNEKRDITDKDYQSGIKRGIYMTLKNLYDKWISTYDEGKFVLKRPEIEDYNFRIKTGALTNVSKTANNDKLLEVDGDFSNFMFVDAFFNDISTKFLCNPEIMYNIIMDQIEGFSNYTMYHAMARFANENQLLFRAFPMFNNFYREDGVVSTFTPYPLINNYSCDESTYVCMYTGELSKKSTLGGGKTDEFIGDSFDIVDDDGTLNSESISTLFKKGEFVEQDGDNIRTTGDKGCRNIIVPAFGVSYALQNQSYFKNIQVNMDSPKVTDYSIQNLFQLSKVNPIGEIVTPHTIAQDAYTIFSNHSYNCTVEMLGDMQIMPLMFFQLRNIPMFKGAYQIIDVEHSVKGGLMTTKFTGVRMSKYVMPYVNDVFSKKNAIQELVKDSVSKHFKIRYQNTVGDIDGSDVTKGELNKNDYFDFSLKISKDTKNKAKTYFKKCVLTEMFNKNKIERNSKTIPELEEIVWIKFYGLFNNGKNFNVNYYKGLSRTGWSIISTDGSYSDILPGDVIIYMDNSKNVYNAGFVIYEDGEGSGFRIIGITGNCDVSKYPNSNGKDKFQIFRFSENMLLSPDNLSDPNSLAALLTPEDQETPKTPEEKTTPKKTPAEGDGSKPKTDEKDLRKKLGKEGWNTLDDTKTFFRNKKYHIVVYYDKNKKVIDTKYFDENCTHEITDKNLINNINKVYKSGLHSADKKYKDIQDKFSNIKNIINNHSTQIKSIDTMMENYAIEKIKAKFKKKNNTGNDIGFWIIKDNVQLIWQQDKVKNGKTHYEEKYLKYSLDDNKKAYQYWAYFAGKGCLTIEWTTNASKYRTKNSTDSIEVLHTSTSKFNKNNLSKLNLYKVTVDANNLMTNLFKGLKDDTIEAIKAELDWSNVKLGKWSSE